MTGMLVLAGDPVAALDAVPKQMFPEAVRAVRELRPKGIHLRECEGPDACDLRRLF
jgi:hypothetical protein